MFSVYKSGTVIPVTSSCTNRSPSFGAAGRTMDWHHNYDVVSICTVAV